MNTKYTIPEIAAMLAERTGVSRRGCEAFIREMFRNIGDALTAGESVKIKQLGTFKLTDIEARKSVDVNTGKQIEIPGHRRVSFMASKELAERVNAPFEMFETVELAPEVTEEELQAAEKKEVVAPEPVKEPKPEQPESEPETETETEVAEPDNSSEPKILPEEKEEPIEIAEPETEPEPQEEVENPAEEEPEETPETVSEPQKPQKEVVEAPVYYTEPSEPERPMIEPQEVPKSGKRQFNHGLWIGMVSMFVICAAAFTIYLAVRPDVPENLSAQNTESVEKDTTTIHPIQEIKEEPQTQPEVAETVAAQPAVEVESEKAVETPKAEPAPTKPSDAKVYDTITKTRYLTTMAKEHYGNYHFWPYIYEENKSILGHPDRIKPGTKVVIPSLSKYGVNPNNEADVTKAKRKGASIYARYK